MQIGNYSSKKERERDREGGREEGRERGERGEGESKSERDGRGRTYTEKEVSPLFERLQRFDRPIKFLTQKMLHFNFYLKLFLFIFEDSKTGEI